MISKTRRKSNTMISPSNASPWKRKNITLIPLLLLCLLLLNGCTGKNNVTPPQDPASATEVTLEKEQENEEDKTEELEKKKSLY